MIIQWQEKEEKKHKKEGRKEGKKDWKKEKADTICGLLPGLEGRGFNSWHALTMWSLQTSTRHWILGAYCQGFQDTNSVQQERVAQKNIEWSYLERKEEKKTSLANCLCRNNNKWREMEDTREWLGIEQPNGWALPLRTKTRPQYPWRSIPNPWFFTKRWNPPGWQEGVEFLSLGGRGERDHSKQCGLDDWLARTAIGVIAVVLCPPPLSPPPRLGRWLAFWPHPPLFFFAVDILRLEEGVWGEVP